MAQGYVYICGYDNVVKIGKSSQPDKRIANLNTANPKEIQIYMIVECLDMDLVESRMHKYFDKAHVKGEWYELTSEMKYLIRGIQAIKDATEFDIGVLLGQYSAGVAENMLIKNLEAARVENWRHAMADLIQRKLWALEFAVTSLGLTDFQMFRQRLSEAQTIIDTLPDGTIPMLIRDKATGELATDIKRRDAEDTPAA